MGGWEHPASACLPAWVGLLGPARSPRPQLDGLFCPSACGCPDRAPGLPGVSLRSTCHSGRPRWAPGSPYAEPGKPCGPRHLAAQVSLVGTARAHSLSGLPLTLGPLTASLTRTQEPTHTPAPQEAPVGGKAAEHAGEPAMGQPPRCLPLPGPGPAPLSVASPRSPLPGRGQRRGPPGHPQRDVFRPQLLGQVTVWARAHQGHWRGGACPGMDSWAGSSDGTSPPCSVTGDSATSVPASGACQEPPPAKGKDPDPR